MLDKVNIGHMIRMSSSLTERLEKLSKARDSGLITEEECAATRTRLLESLAIDK